jgi:hypothetical protein
VGRHVLPVLAAALVSAGCASARGWGSPRPEPARPNAGARVEFVPERFDEIFAAAVDLVRDRGLAVALCQARRGALATVPVELDAPCGGSTCLARETTRVKLGYRRARVVVTREVWDPSIRGWREQGDPRTDAELSRVEHELASTMVRRGATAPGDRPSPCAERRCGGGACVLASAAPRP